ncbi:cyclophilin-like fold protein [Pseudomonas sp. C11]|uniref:cyclophilin-like fold protein n=1 Tax=Pseudomonas sp. C11 TaxID=3075550 RepID=UPI002AFEC63E|nr:cyclophilin-like fold protein [Pseudomonas sp. C11]
MLTKVKITTGEHVLTATLLDNATTKAFVAKLPLTLPMMDLYSRELVYRFPEALPANETKTSGYEVGDIVYWAPRHSFVIMYAQNGERISDLQKVGTVDSDVDVLRHVGDVDVTFELLKD